MTVTLDDALEEVVGFLDRFMAMSSEQLDAVALWVAHTHLVAHLNVCAYMFVKSPTKRCGKSLLLDLLEKLVLNGRSTANISPAALYRMLDEHKPTLLFDEIDNIFRPGKADPSKAELTGLINAGFHRGRVAYRMGGANMRTLEEFDAFGPKALAGIGNCLPDTTADRAIPIVLERKARSVLKERYRIRLHEDEAEAVRGRLASAVAAHQDAAEAWPRLPDELNDRQQDIWEPMLALADAAGGTWPKRARRAAVHLHAAQDDTESTSSRLLEDLRTIFRPRDDDGELLPVVEKMLTKDIVSALNILEESPWSDWRGGNGITSNAVAKILKSYGVASEHMRTGADRGRGFTIDALDRVFSRYLADDTVDTADNGTKPQVEAVNTSPNPTVDANVDAPDLRISAPVNAVNADNGTPPNGTEVADVAEVAHLGTPEYDEELLRGAG